MMPESAPGSAQQGTPPDDSPWWMKYLARFLGTASSIGALAFGVVACISFTPKCILSGILQMICGVVVGIIEAPCLCMFLDFAQAPSAFFDRKPYWYRAVLYGALSIMPMSLCPIFSTFIGSGLILITGILYGVLALGKKASSTEMRVKASSSYNLLGAQQKPPGYIESNNPAPNAAGETKYSGTV